MNFFCYIFEEKKSHFLVSTKDVFDFNNISYYFFAFEPEQEISKLSLEAVDCYDARPQE